MHKDWILYDGWIWLDGYQLNAKGDAVAQRSIFVRPAGLVLQPPTVAVRRPRPPGSASSRHRVCF
ncbi:hypothetical protein OG559_13530 [Micromonospora sp. NBC_01405]|uniref:hypothetical protein n=1 Tax=Micromonospora sp. NBC_01405 TaxID=2903589 RepID=UPI00324F4F5C